jgi:hypothetical protein
LEAEDYGDVDSGFDGLAAERGGLVAPLADGVRSGGDEERRAGHLVNILHGAVAVNDYVELDDAFDALMLGVLGIDGLNTGDQLAQLEAGALF